MLRGLEGQPQIFSPAASVHHPQVGTRELGVEPTEATAEGSRQGEWVCGAPALPRVGEIYGPLVSFDERDVCS